MFGFKKVYCLLSVILFTSLPVFSAINADSFNLANSNAPKWRGMEIFKHLNDYKTVNAKEYISSYRAKYTYSYYMFLTPLDLIKCSINTSDAPGYNTNCDLSYTTQSVNLDPFSSDTYKRDGLYSNKNDGGKSVKTLPVGFKIVLPKMDAKKFAQQVEFNLAADNENVSLTCVVAAKNSVACRNSNKHGFVIDGNDIKTF